MLTRSTHRPALFSRIGLTIGSVLFALCVVELILRTFVPVRGTIYELDDRYLFRQIPGARKLVGQAGRWPKVLVQINADGRRGDESALPRAAHRVVVYGDSFIAAEATQEADTYVQQLGRVLSAQLGPTTVLNAGVTGYGVDQESLRIDDETPGLRPDLVVVATYAGNDFGDLLRDKLFRLDDDGGLKRNSPTIDPCLRAQFQSALQLSPIQIIRAAQVTYQALRPRPPGPAVRSSVPLDSMATLLGHRVAEYEEYVLRGDSVVRNLLDDEYDADVSLTPDSDSARYRVLLMERVIERIRTTIQHDNAKLLLLIIPEWCDLSESCDVSAARRRYPGYRPGRLTDAIDVIATRDQIAHLNLFDAFRRQSVDALYNHADRHWSSTGQHLAAHLTADLIVRTGLLPDRPRR
jgi:hypothetical protein